MKINNDCQLIEQELELNSYFLYYFQFLIFLVNVSHFILIYNNGLSLKRYFKVNYDRSNT